MDSVKYIGMDVHKEAISIAVLDSKGKLVMEGVIETKGARTILQFFQGLCAATATTITDAIAKRIEQSNCQPQGQTWER